MQRPSNDEEFRLLFDERHAAGLNKTTLAIWWVLFALVVAFTMGQFASAQESTVVYEYSVDYLADGASTPTRAADTFNDSACRESDGAVVDIPTQIVMIPTQTPTGARLEFTHDNGDGDPTRCSLRVGPMVATLPVGVIFRARVTAAYLNRPLGEVTPISDIATSNPFILVPPIAMPDDVVIVIDVSVEGEARVDVTVNGDPR